MNMFKLNQNGAMSMLTVIFLALLLTIITTSFVRLSVTEQRQSIDDDLTNRAFYAAESGIEDAKRAIAAHQNGEAVNLNGDVCAPADIVTTSVLSSELDTEYTCQLIDMSPGNFESALDDRQAVTIPLTSVGAFTQIQIDWHYHQEGDDYDRRSAQDLPTTSAWNGNGFPAMLRATLFSHGGATFDGSEIDDSARTLFINPASSGGTAHFNNDEGQIVNGNCAGTPAGGSLACSITISGVDSSRTNYLRLQSLYRNTNVQVNLIGTTLEDVQVVVDVTGRAGDVFRRVEARLSLVQQNFPLTDIALWSNTDICKDFVITDAASGYSNSCPWDN